MPANEMAYKGIEELEELAADPASEDFYGILDASKNRAKKISSSRIKSNSTGWNDYLFSGLSLGFGASPPDLEVFRDGIMQRAFVGTGVLVEEGYFDIHVLHDYKVGTKLYPHIHWSHKIGAPTGNVVWQIEYLIAKGHSGGVFGASTTIELIEAAGVQYTHQLIETEIGDAIDAALLEPDTLILGRVFRDPAHASDTFENDAFLLQIDFHVESDLIMTNEKVSPFTKSQI